MLKTGSRLKTQSTWSCHAQCLTEKLQWKTSTDLVFQVIFFIFFYAFHECISAIGMLPIVKTGSRLKAQSTWSCHARCLTKKLWWKTSRICLFFYFSPFIDTFYSFSPEIGQKKGLLIVFLLLSLWSQHYLSVDFAIFGLDTMYRTRLTPSVRMYLFSTHRTKKLGPLLSAQLLKVFFFTVKSALFISRKKS